MDYSIMPDTVSRLPDLLGKGQEEKTVR